MSHLSYHFSTLQYHLKTYIKLKFYWLWGQDLNLRMDESKSSAFTNFATPQYLDWLLVVPIFFTWVTILFLLRVRTLTRIFKCNLIKLETSDCQSFSMKGGTIIKWTNITSVRIGVAPIFPLRYFSLNYLTTLREGNPLCSYLMMQYNIV